MPSSLLSPGRRVALRPTNAHAPGWNRYAAAVRADGPSAYWPLNEGAGKAFDRSGNGNTGTYAGVVTLGQPGPLAAEPNGVPDTAVLLDGSTGLVTSSAAINWGATGGTVEAWTKQTATANDQTILGATGNTSFTFRWRAVGLLSLCLGGFTDGANAIQTAAVSATLTNWTHAVVTWHPVNGFSAYVNGLLVKNTTTNLTSFATTGVQIGMRGDSTMPFNGTLGQVLIYPAALSAARVQAHYNAAVGR